MKPASPRNIPFIATCLFVGLFFSGCATPKMEEKLLHQCIIRGDSEGAMKLINAGALNGHKAADLGEPLYYAGLKNDTNVVRALLAKGANPNWTGWLTPVGQTPVSAAARTRSEEALRVLIKHGGSVLESGPNYKEYLTPFEVSVLEVEPPGPVTDLLIEAGARPRKKSNSAVAAAGTHWAFASYLERHGDIAGAVEFYGSAGKWYEKAARKMVGDARYMSFVNSPFIRTLVEIRTLPETVFLGDNLASVKTIEGRIAGLQDKAERYAAYSKLCADRAGELKESQNRGRPSDSTK